MAYYRKMEELGFNLMLSFNEFLGFLHVTDIKNTVI